jgi:LysM repeat protein
VVLPPGTSLEAVALCSQTSLEEIKNLNPHLLRQSTPPDTSYPVRIPKGKEAVFWECFLALPVPKRQLMFVKARGNHLKKYKVQKGDTLFRIAKSFGVSVRELKTLNRIKNDSDLRIGQELLIPEKERSEAKAISFTKGRANKRVVHVVKEGETLWRIAKSYGVSVEDLKRWNKLEGKTIRPHERLLIYTD